MMTKNLPLVALAVAACLTAALPAQGGRGRRRMPPPPAMQAIDVDGNGELSSEEIDDATRSLLTLDKDGDGNLTLAELTPPMAGRGERPPFGGPGGPGGPGGMGMGVGTHPLMKALDQDGDGELFED